MTAQSKTIIKTYFQAGDRPTQGQFENLIDSYQDYSSVLTALASANTGTVGLQVLSASTTAAAQNALGAGTVGAQLFACATTAAATNIIGVGVGDMTKAVYDPANLQEQVVTTSAAQTVRSKIVITATSSAAAAGFRIPHGAAPAAPSNGDLWSTTSGLFARINSNTSQFITSSYQGVAVASGTVTFSGGTPSLSSGSFNISSISDGGTGTTTINLSITMIGNYQVIATTRTQAVGGIHADTRTGTSFVIKTYGESSGSFPLADIDFDFVVYGTGS